MSSDLPIRYETSRGTPDQVQEQLRRAVAQYARDPDGFKIGRTSEPESRWATEYADSYSEMVVVYESDREDFVAEVETDLIEFFFDDSDNELEGSAGRWGDPPYFVYVVLD